MLMPSASLQWKIVLLLVAIAIFSFSADFIWASAALAAFALIMRTSPFEEQKKREDQEAFSEVVDDAPPDEADDDADDGDD
ncbi:MAG: hypothetical protein ABH863_04535 [Candidatus Micrarchaeota archaeon]